jgi:hypothetical protein
MKQLKTAGANTTAYVTGADYQEVLERRRTGALQNGAPSAHPNEVLRQRRRPWLPCSTRFRSPLINANRGSRGTAFYKTADLTDYLGIS